MIMKRIFAIILLMVGVITAFAQPEKQFKEANELYAANQFSKAVKLYESIVGQGLESAELYFNLGNACYKNGELTKAVLYLERAKLLAPNDEDIQFNLDLVNQFVVDKIEPLPRPFFVKWGQSFLNMFTSNGWAWISILTFILALVGAGLYIFSRNENIRKITVSLALVLVVIAVFSFSFAGKQKAKLTKHNFGVIFTPTVTVKSSPDNSGTDLFVIHEGLKVEIKDEVGSWYNVRLADGNSGWVLRTVLEKI
jgi:tetratricopeptide (TPR) repeat protein